MVDSPLGKTVIRRMDVLFVPFYYHIQYRRFQLLEQRLRANGLTSTLWYIPNISAMDQSNLFGIEQFKRDQFSYRQFLCLPRPIKWPILRQLIQVVLLGIDYFRMKKALKKMNPKVVVIGSHLGGLYIRLLQKICDELKIPVFSLWANHELKTPTKKTSGWRAWLGKVFPLNLFFNWGSLGAYPHNLTFLAVSKVILTQILAWGALEEQVQLIGDPMFDSHQNVVSLSPSFKQGHPIRILLVTEVVHEVLGIDYLQSFVQDLATGLQTIQVPFEIKIKFHPRETKHTKQIFTQGLSAFTIHPEEETVSLDKSLDGIDFCLGMYSQFLQHALGKGKPVVVYNPTNNPVYSVYQQFHDQFLCANHVRELSELLQGLSSNTHVQKKACALVEIWQKENIYQPDNGCCDKTADLISKKIQQVS